MFSYLNSLISQYPNTASPVLFQVQVSSMAFCHVLSESISDISSCDSSHIGQGCFWTSSMMTHNSAQVFQSIRVLFTCLRKPASFTKLCTSLLVHPMWRLLLSQWCVGEAKIKAGLSFCHSWSYRSLSEADGDRWHRNFSEFHAFVTCSMDVWLGRSSILSY